MTVGREFVADLQAVKSALSHIVPDGSLEKVIHECLRRTLRECARRRGETPNPRTRRTAGHETGPVNAAESSGRDVPAEVQRIVWTRDEGCCTFVGSDGHRCRSTHQLQFHHEHAYAKGGPATVANVRVLCFVHNQFLAEKEFGAEHMSRAREERRRQMALF